MSKIKSQINRIIISASASNRDENKTNNLNNDNNLIKNNILPSKEIPDLMKGSKSNRNKLNIFHSPRNQIIKHFKESLSKTSEGKNNLKNNNPNNNNKMKKTKSSNKIISSNKTESINKNIDESVWDSLAKKNMFLFNQKNLEKNSNLAKDKDIPQNIKFNRNNLNIKNKIHNNLNHKEFQKQLSLDYFLTNQNNIDNIDNNNNNKNKNSNLITDQNKINKNLENDFKNEFYSLTNLRNAIDGMNGFENSINYNLDEQIEDENNKNLVEKNFLNINFINSDKKFKENIKADINIKYPQAKEYNVEIDRKNNSNNSNVIDDKTAKNNSNLNSFDTNNPYNSNTDKEKSNIPFNKPSNKSNNTNIILNDYYSNYNSNLFGKKLASVSKSINFSKIQSKKRLNTNKNLSYGNPKNLMSEKILITNNFTSNSKTKLNNIIKNKEEAVSQQVNPNLKELEKLITTEKNSLAKKKSMDKILSAKKFLNVNRIPTTVNFNISNNKQIEENKFLNKNKNDHPNKKNHFNSFSIANLISPHKNINLSQNFETNFVENHLIKSNKNIINNTNNKSKNYKINKPNKNFVSISHDFMNNLNNNVSHNYEIEEYKRKSNREFKSDKKKNYFKNYANGLEQISFKSFESGSSKYDLNSFSRGNAYNANKSEDFEINKNLNKEIFSNIKHQESIKTYEQIASDNKIKKDCHNDNLHLPYINSQENLVDKNTIANNFDTQKENGATENKLNFSGEENNNINQINLPLKNEVVFDKEKSNLINLNTYTLLKKQRNKNSLVNNDLDKKQESIQESLDLPRQAINKPLITDNDYERKLTKESALQSNIELNVEVEENDSFNNINSSLNNLNDKNCFFKKSENMNSVNYERNIVNTNFSNKSFGNIAEVKFFSNKENENKTLDKRNKTKDLLDAIIPSPIPKKKDKPNFNEIIKDLKHNYDKYSPLKIQKNDSLNKNYNNYIGNKDFIENQNKIESLNKSIEINKIQFNSNERVYYEKSISINKINKVNLDNYKNNNKNDSENLVTTKNVNKANLENRNKISGKDLSNSFIKAFKYQNNNENENLDFNESPIKLCKLSNNENIINNVTFPLQENSDIKLNSALGDKTEMSKIPIRKESFNNNENLEEIKKLNSIKEFSTINNIYDELINTSKGQTDKKLAELNINNENSNNSNLKVSDVSDHFAFRKINYNIDLNNNFRNKQKGVNIIQNKKAELENLTSIKNIIENISSNNNENNKNKILNIDKNSNTLSTIFNENEFNNTNKNHLFHKNYPNFKERKNKNSLNNFAEEYKNKFTNLTDISHKNNFTISSILMENTNYNNFNFEKKSSYENAVLNKSFKNKINIDNHILIDESDYTQVQDFQSNPYFNKLDLSKKQFDEGNNQNTVQANKISLHDLDEEIIANEIPLNFNSIMKNKTSKISGIISILIKMIFLFLNKI